MATNYSGNLAYSDVSETVYGGILYVLWQPDGRAVLLQFADLAIPTGALVRRVRCRVKARAPGFVNLAEVAEVRAAGEIPDTTSSEIVVDFKGVRTIASLGPQNGVGAPSSAGVTYAVWSGSSFGSPKPLASFSEVATERIRLQFASAVNPAAIASTWTTTLPSPPQHVDLTVNGGRVWSGGVATPAEPGSEYDVDVTVDVTTAVAAAVTTGAVPVHVELTSTQPADLELEVVDLDVLHVFDVGFPEGASRRVQRSEEGAWSLDLPLAGLPGGAAGQAEIQRIELTVTAEVGNTRVVPAVGPVASADATVALAPGRTVYLRLPASTLASFEHLAGFRLALATEAETELSAVVHGPSAPHPDDAPPTVDPALSPMPGEVLADAIVTPAIIAPGEVRWVTLLVEEPLELIGDDVWIALTPVRGTAALATTDASAIAPADRAAIRWRAASGAFRSLSAPGELAALDAMVRAIGIARSENPVGSVRMHVATREAVAIVADPPAAGQRFAIDLGAEPVSAVDQGLGAIPAFRLEMLTTTPGTYTFDQIRVFYTPIEETP